MKALSLRAAANCETAKHKTCRCRCGGALHGRWRDVEPDAEFFAKLPADDPHHVDDGAQRKTKRNAKRRAKRQAQREAERERRIAWLRERQMELFS